MGIIKTGLFIEGVEVTSEHIGKNLKVVSTTHRRWLPVGFVTTIVDVFESLLVLRNVKGESSWYGVAALANNFEFEWVTLPKPKNSSTKSQRQKLAKAIKEAKVALDSAIQEAEEVGMKVDISNDGVKITFNPPVEEY